ncbi:MAG: hypothetical protein U9N54_12975 [candidate division Zixibacteria bacterium]|nr:hypothetical protein [candidate division Zixibacteria bacterium]
MQRITRNKLILILFLISGFILSCGTKDGDKSENNLKTDTAKEKNIATQIKSNDTSYENWISYTYEDIIILYSSENVFVDNLEGMAKGFMKFRKQVCDYFSIQIPKDTITIYYYTGYGQLEKYTGINYPLVDGNKIHYSMPFNLGASMTEYVLYNWHPIEPKFNFIKQGIMTLFDFSGQDYHEMTLNFIDEKKLLSLEELVADTTINMFYEKYQSAEAASFVAFVLENYHLEALEKLYLSEDSFPKAVNEIFKTNVDVLQNRWLEFTEKAYYRQLNN